MTAARMWVSCGRCGGRGSVNPGRDPQNDRDCPVCAGDGLTPWRKEAS